MPRLGQLLVRADLVSENNLARALGVQHFAGGRLGTLLLERGSLSEDDVGKMLAEQHGCDYVPWRRLADVPPGVIAALPAKFAIKHSAVPYERSEGSLKVVLRDPADLRILDELFFVTGRKIIAGVAPEVRIYQALEKYYGERRTPRYAILAEKLSRPVRGSRTESTPPPPPPRFFPEAERTPRPLPESHEIWGDSSDADLAAGPAIVQSWKMPEPSGGWAGTSPRKPRFSSEIEAISWEEMPPSPALWTQEPSAPEAPEKTEPEGSAAVSPRAAMPEPAVAQLAAPEIPPPPAPAAVLPVAAAADPDAPTLRASLPSPLEAFPMFLPAEPAVSEAAGIPGTAESEPEPPRAPASSPESAGPARAGRDAPAPDLPADSGPPSRRGRRTSGKTRPRVSSPAEAPPPAAPPAAAPVREGMPAASDFPAVAGAADRDAVMAAALEALAHRFSRAAVFAARPDGVTGWGGAGEVSDERIRAMNIPWSEPSVFLNVRLSRSFYLGPLLRMPWHEELALALHSWPEEFVVHPVLMKDRPVAFFYAESPKERGVTPMDLVYLRELAEAAGAGFAGAIRLRKKEI